MTTYVMRDGQLVEKSEAAPHPRAPYVISDLPAYKSPLGTGVIDGRRARREDMKRGNCREVEPSEFRATYKNERFAKKYGLPINGRD